ncbi:uncharacterized [Tachysurus ichikawai]
MLAPLFLTQTVSEPRESRAEWLDQTDMLEEMGLNGEACEELITALMLHFIIVFLASAAPSVIRPSLRPSVVQLRPLLLFATLHPDIMVCFLRKHTDLSLFPA